MGSRDRLPPGREIGQTRVSGVRNGKLSDESNNSDRVTADDPWGSYLGEIRTPCPDERDNGGKDVDWDGEKLCVGTGVAEAVDNGWNSRCETVNSDCVAPEDDRGSPNLPIGQSSENMTFVDFVTVGRTSCTR
jgi:hypothetical protein